MKRAGIFTAGLAGVSMLTSITTFAQTPPQGKEKSQSVVIRTDNIEVNAPGPDDVIAGPPMAPAAVGVKGQGTFVFINSEFSFDGKVVKNAPYSGAAVTETTQTLSDGNRIVRKNTASIFRDSEGRTRREQSITAIGPYGTAGDVPESIVINDPVAGVSYVLDSRSKIARKIGIRTNVMFRTQPGGAGMPGTEIMTMQVPGPAGVGASGPVTVVSGGMAPVASASGAPEGYSIGTAPPQAGAVAVSGVGGGAGSVEIGQRMMTYERTQVGPGGAETHLRVASSGRASGHEPKVEQLGKQLVEGVDAEGTRTTVTIPAGEIGNERPIEIVDERWYSPELQTLVMSKRTDPMSGDMTYRLTNINRNEPVRSLFEVPGDYKLKEGPAMPEFKRSMRTAPGN